ncbi:MAG: hypothetical protein U1E39_09500 [Planctomycetota bacterium]
MNFRNPIDITVARPAPSEALERMERVALRLAKHAETEAHLRVETNFRNADVSLTRGATEESLRSELEEIHGALAAGGHETIAKIGWRAERRNSQNRQEFAVEIHYERRREQATDLLRITTDGNAIQAQAVIGAAVDSVGAEFPTLQWPDARFVGLPEELRAFHKSQEETFAARESALLAARREFEAARKSAFDEREAERKQLQADVDARRKALDGEYEEKRKSLDAQHETRKTDLESKEKSLAARTAALDDRDRMHARRDFFKELRKLIEGSKALVLSEGTAKKRRTIHWICGGALSAAVGLAVFALVEIAEKGINFPVGSIFFSGTVLFASTLVFYLRWNDRWFSRHADSELDSRNRERGLLGTAAIVELLFEWNKDTKGDKPFPPELLRALTAELLPPPLVAGGTAHPAESVLATLENLKSLELGGKAMRFERFPSAPTSTSS